MGCARVLQRALEQVVEVGGDPGAAAQAGQAAVVVGRDGVGRVGGFDKVAQELAAGALVLVVLSHLKQVPATRLGQADAVGQGRDQLAPVGQAGTVAQPRSHEEHDFSSSEGVDQFGGDVHAGAS